MGTHEGFSDEDYINMELISSSSSSSSCCCSPTKSTEFEFQCLSASNHNPADKLFYKGRLLPLPLHLLPGRGCSTTPLHSCTNSPSQSARLSSDINPTFFNNTHLTNHSWPIKLKKKLINHSKSSTAFLKSLFFTNSHHHHNNYFKKLATFIKKTPVDDRRRSFSGSITAHYSSSSSASFNSMHFSRRSSSASEIEISIHEAIAYCKKSMQTSGICSLPCAI